MPTETEATLPVLRCLSWNLPPVDQQSLGFYREEEVDLTLQCMSLLPSQNQAAQKIPDHFP